MSHIVIFEAGDQSVQMRLKGRIVFLDFFRILGVHKAIAFYEVARGLGVCRHDNA